MCYEWSSGGGGRTWREQRGYGVCEHVYISVARAIDTVAAEVQTAGAWLCALASQDCTPMNLS